MTSPSTGAKARRKPQSTSQFGQHAIHTQRADPCTMVIFGATGDLTKRKLLPALYSLAAEHLLDPNFAVLGVGREEETDEGFRERMKDAVQHSDEVKHFDEEVWGRLSSRLFYCGG